MSDLGGSASTSRNGRATALWVGAVVLVAAATGILVLSDDARLLRLGLVAALWAALIGAFAVVRVRNRAADNEEYAAERQRVYELELEREVAARREFEWETEAEVRREVRDESDSEIRALRAELQTLRETLEQLVGGDVLFERVALRAESTRLRSLNESLNSGGDQRAVRSAETWGSGRYGTVSGNVQYEADQSAAQPRTVQGQPAHVPAAQAQPAQVESTQAQPAQSSPAAAQSDATAAGQDRVTPNRAASTRATPSATPAPAAQPQAAQQQPSWPTAAPTSHGSAGTQFVAAPEQGQAQAAPGRAAEESQVFQRLHRSQPDQSEAAPSEGARSGAASEATQPPAAHSPAGHSAAGHAPPAPSAAQTGEFPALRPQPSSSQAAQSQAAHSQAAHSQAAHSQAAQSQSAHSRAADGGQQPRSARPHGSQSSETSGQVPNPQRQRPQRSRPSRRPPSAPAAEQFPPQSQQGSHHEAAPRPDGSAGVDPADAGTSPPASRSAAAQQPAAQQPGSQRPESQQPESQQPESQSSGQAQRSGQEQPSGAGAHAEGTSVTELLAAYGGSGSSADSGPLGDGGEPKRRRRRRE